MRRPNTSRGVLMALAVACLTLAVMPSTAYAGGNRSFVHRAGQGYAPGTSVGRLGVINLHRASSFRGLRQTKKFGRHLGGSRQHARFKRLRNHKGRKHLRSGRHHRLGRHYLYARRYDDRYARYDRNRYEARRDADDAAGSYDPTSRATANTRPTFKWRIECRKNRSPILMNSLMRRAKALSRGKTFHLTATFSRLPMTPRSSLWSRKSANMS